MPNLKIQKNIPLSPLTTFHLGGPAKFFVETKNKEELTEAIEWSNKNNEPFFILGGGSNIIISDQGVNGLVIKLNNDQIQVKGERLECGAGAMFSRAMSIATGLSLTGLEWAAGIPGTVGGAIRGNAGAFGSSISDVVETVDIFLVKEKRFICLSRNDCQFSYRQSIFKNDPQKIIWNVVLKLKKGNKEEIEAKIKKYLEHRQKTQPKLPSAGCIFKNIDFDYLKNANSELASLALEKGIVKNNKISAAWVIDYLGLKGKTIGGVKISLEHANFIVNTGHGKAEEVIMLISYIKQQIRDKLGVQLEEEVQYFGF